MGDEHQRAIINAPPQQQSYALQALGDLQTTLDNRADESRALISSAAHNFPGWDPETDPETAGAALSFFVGHDVHLSHACQRTLGNGMTTTANVEATLKSGIGLVNKFGLYGALGEVPDAATVTPAATATPAVTETAATATPAAAVGCRSHTREPDEHTLNTKS
eukprot:m.127180 g.127180  ORF g.127180 m.127180 type:complete len:164 (+) comp16697_c0_seq1:314-805(+)